MTRNKLYILLSCACILGYIWLYLSSVVAGQEIIVCFFKRLYGIPCPSCGSTRGLLALFQGEWKAAFMWNPNSYLLASLLVFVPVWIVWDCLGKKDTLYLFLKRAERLASGKLFWIVFIPVVLLNWIWTIQKGL